MAEIFEGKVGLPNLSLREYSYASGWMRAQLPNMVTLFADYRPPVLGKDSASHLMVYHQGYISGNVAYVSLFPETSAAVVVLGNSAVFTNTMRLLGQILVETVFKNEFSVAEYLKTAQQASDRRVGYVARVYKQLLDGRTSLEPSRRLSAYVGRYYNTIGNFFIEVKVEDGKLQVANMGADHDTFDLESYEEDGFFW